MGLFSSSWKYQAFAASSPLFETEADWPHTFEKVMLEGLSADDTFGNIIRYTQITDMYARAKAMVRYATRDVDPYVRGLPTSNLITTNVQKTWVEEAILREIKMPLEDFFWFRHGLFDAQYVGCKFIHDHYMDIDYFPWPGGCLPDIKNPNFDDQLDWWIPTNFSVDTAARVAVLDASDGTLYSEMVGQINPGDIISLRATVCRGTDKPNTGGFQQYGTINLTFYNSLGAEIETMSASNTTGGALEWELLTVIATAPANSVTVKAWAGGKLGDQAFKFVVTVDDSSFKLPLPQYLYDGTTLAVYDFYVDWGTGEAIDHITSYNQSEANHPYAGQTGDFTVSITGRMDAFSFYRSASTDQNKVINFLQWGDVQIKEFLYMFRDCQYMGYAATDAPKLDPGTYVYGSYSLYEMFYACGYISGSCTGTFAGWTFPSFVSEFAYMFNYCKWTLPGVGSWVIPTAADDFTGMFDSAINFNEDLSGAGWQIYNAYYLDSMLSGADAWSNANYDALLLSWSALTWTYTGLSFTCEAQYTESAARAILTGSPNNWTIYDGGPA